MTGSVTLVGAGPGDAGLLTRKGYEAIQNATVVVFDRLVGEAILSLIPQKAERIDVGKRASHHPVPQEQINQILLQKALAGERVVRLKGGDPFVFGRGGEELELLQENSVPFAVVPGVTSAIAAPSYAGIPATHRDFCSSVHIITGHARAGQQTHIDYDALKRTGGTLVFLMGVSAMRDICAGLLQAGMPKDTPAAMVESGTLPQQRKVVSKLARLPEDAEKAAIHSPAIIIVGKVCSLSERFDWFSRLPLHGKRIIVTRPKDRAGSLCQELRALGADVLEYPCIRTVAREPATELDRAIAEIARYKWLVFTSPAGPALFFQRLFAAGKDARALCGIKIAAIGPKTAEELARFGVRADLVPDVYDANHLAKAMEAVEGAVLLCRASKGNDILPATFSKIGVPFLDAPCYDTVYECPDADAARAYLSAPVLVSFTSASTVRGFVKSLPDADLANVIGCCIGEQTEQEAKRFGLRTARAKEATIASLIECIKEVQV